MKEIFIVCTICIYGAAFSQPIEQIVEQVVTQNLQVHSLKLQHKSARQRAEQVATHSSPLLSFGVGVLPPETRLGAQVASVNVQQFLPWFGTLKVRSQSEQLLAADYQLAAKGAELETVAKAKEAYYMMSLLFKKRQIIQNYIRLLSALLDISKVHVETGKSLSSDALRIQVQLQDLEYQLTTLKNERNIYQAQINELRNRPLEDSVWVTPNFAEDVAALRIADAQYSDTAVKNLPALLQLENKISHSKLVQRINKKNSMPRIGFGIEYRSIQERVDAQPTDNGRDILIPKISIALPLYRSKYKAKHREEALRQQAIQAQRQNKHNQIRYAIHSLKERYSKLLTNIRFLKDQVRTTESAYRVLMSFYSSRGGRFDELLKTQRHLIQYELELTEAYVQTHVLQAQLGVFLF